MASFFPYTAQCSCGHPLPVNLADGVNVGRSPHLRQQIIDATFHKATCGSCGHTATIEKGFVYTDQKRGCLFQVLPRHDRHTWRSESMKLNRSASAFPATVPTQERKNLRVVYGMSELREKLIAQDLNLDDRAVELLKIAVVNDHPFLLHRPRLRLSLDGASHDEIHFVAAFDHNDALFRLGLPAARATELLDTRQTLQNWVETADHENSILKLDDDLWVNMWRWSPQPDSLEKLMFFAAEVRAGRNIDPTSNDFRRMLAGLPRGTHLPGWAKTDIQLLFDKARTVSNDDLQEALFEIRFGKNMTGDWSTNSDEDDIDSIWKLLKALPASHFERNSSIRNIELGGDGGGLYYPSTGDIYIGERSDDREGFEDVIRHEVAHGVQENRRTLIDPWLRQRFGWQMFAATEQGVNDWVNLMGGWQQFDISDSHRRDVPTLLRSALGDGATWNPPPAPQAPMGHGWNNRNFGPRLAFMQSGANWYRNHASWYRANGYAFFLNFWYRALCAVSLETLALVQQMPSNYAAMSSEEFFAELYALYYDLDDPARLAIPSDVKQWFDTNLSDAAFAGPGGLPSKPAGDPWADVARPQQSGEDL